MTGNLTRCPLCLEPVALCSCDELERDVAMAAGTVRGTLTRAQAREAGYTGYAEHLPHVPCPGQGDKGIYCASCQGALAQLGMTKTELNEAIPPAYTELIGKQLLDALLERMPPTSHAGEA